HEADAMKRRFSCCKLLENLHAAPRLLHHASDAANLPFDAVQAGDESVLLRGAQHGDLRKAMKTGVPTIRRSHRPEVPPPYTARPFPGPLRRSRLRRSRTSAAALERATPLCKGTARNERKPE